MDGPASQLSKNGPLGVMKFLFRGRVMGFDGRTGKGGIACSDVFRSVFLDRYPAAVSELVFFCPSQQCLDTA